MKTKRAFLTSVIALCGLSCAARPHMCISSAECSLEKGQKACVAGRCQDPNGVALIDKREVRRQVVAPSAVGYVQRSEGGNVGTLPPIFTLGRAGAGDGRLFLRFDIPLVKEMNIVEAYVLLDRPRGLEPDPRPIVLHAERVVDPWDPRSISWTSQPRFEDVRAPATRVPPAGRRQVRIDVRDIVRNWYLHLDRDQGIVIVADNSTDVGMAFALTSQGAPAEASGANMRPTPPSSSGDFASDSAGDPSNSALLVGPPRLELYIKPESTRTQ